jgi:hypothetical protein
MARLSFLKLNVLQSYEGPGLRMKHERSSDPADSGKKVLPGVERFRSRVFFGIRGPAERRESTFLPVSKTFSTKRFPRSAERVLGGESRLRRMC